MNDNSIWKKSSFVFFMALICCGLWSSAAPFIKTGYVIFDIQDTASILVFAGIRFTLAGVLVLMLDRRIHRDRQKSIHLKYVGILAMCQTFGQYFFYYVGLAYTSGVAASVIIGTGALLALLFAVYVFKTESMTSSKLLGVLLGFSGILIMNIGQQGTGSVFGNGFILASQICSALSSCCINIFSSEDDPVSLSGSQFFLGGVLLVIVGIGMGGHIPVGNWMGYGILFYLACVSAIAYTLWSVLLSHNPVSRIGIYNSLIPVLGVVLSALILQEMKQAYAIKTWISLVLVSLGIYVVTKSKKARLNSNRTF